MSLRTVLLILGLALAAAAQAPRICLVLPFENRAGNESLDWIGESFYEPFADQLAPAVTLVDRAQRAKLLVVAGLPADAPLSHATALELADSIDADCLVSGWFNFDGAQLSATAYVFDLRLQNLTTLQQQTAQLDDLQALETKLAAAARNVLEAGAAPVEPRAEAPLPMPPAAWEDYIRGVTAPTPAERLRRLGAAAELAPHDARVVYALGLAYAAAQDDHSALIWLAQVAPGTAEWAPAQFAAGLAAYRLGDYARAAALDSAVAAHWPLPPVLNNWALAEARQGGAAHRAAAVARLENALAASPGDPVLDANLKLLRALPAPESAAADPWRAAQLETELPVEQFRELAGAIAEFDAAKAAALPENERVAFDLGEADRLLQEGALDAAATAYATALGIVPPGDARDQARALAGQAQVEAARQAWDTAYTAAQRSLTLQPSAAAYRVRAQVEIVRRQFISASHDLASALRLDPHDAQARALQQQIPKG